MSKQVIKSLNKEERNRIISKHNYSNCKPTEGRIVVYLHEVPVSGPLLVNEQIRETKAASADSGILVEVGDKCFTKMKNPPELGDVVRFQPWSGFNISAASPVKDGLGDSYLIHFKVLPWEAIQGYMKPVKTKKTKTA